MKVTEDVMPTMHEKQQLPCMCRDVLTWNLQKGVSTILKYVIYLRYIYIFEVCDIYHLTRQISYQKLHTPVRKQLSKLSHEADAAKQICHIYSYFFFYQSVFYKNIEAEICKILRINLRLRFWKWYILSVKISKYNYMFLT